MRTSSGATIPRLTCEPRTASTCTVTRSAMRIVSPIFRVSTSMALYLARAAPLRKVAHALQRHVVEDARLEHLARRERRLQRALELHQERDRLRRIGVLDL